MGTVFEFCACVSLMCC